MSYTYKFTHNLRSRDIFFRNVRNFASLLMEINGDRERYRQKIGVDMEKTERNVFTETTKYLHMRTNVNGTTNICREIFAGNLINALRHSALKFQYPNFCANNGPEAQREGIKLAPIKVILKFLFLKYLNNPQVEPHLTIEEIKIFIFKNPEAYSTEYPNILKIWSEILIYRDVDNIPVHINDDFDIVDRDLNDMLKLMSYLEFVKYENEQVSLTFDLLNREYEHSLLEVVKDDSFLEFEEGTNAYDYFSYVDLPNVGRQYTEYTPDVDLSHILDWFESHPEQTYSEDLISNLHINLNCLPYKHFVILSGISGSGKTNLIKQYANAVYNLNPDQDNPFFQLISVRPDWDDEKPLLGYYNALEQKYEEPMFLKILVEANNNPDKKYFICLDEMNLAHVEYYFADFLSKVEARESLIFNNYYLHSLKIPTNVFIIGTINEDETTQRISDKVLDRAFKVEMNEINLDQFITTYCRENQKNQNIVNDLNVIIQMNNILKRISMHFGYRVVKEIIEKLEYNYTVLNMRIPSSKIVDTSIVEKIIPKLKVDLLSNEVLDELLKMLSQGNYPESTVQLQKILNTINTEVMWG